MKKLGVGFWVSFTVLFAAIVIGVLCAIIFTPKATPATVVTVAANYGKQVYPSFNTLQYNGHRFQVNASASVSVWQYQWKSPSSPTYVTVWDSANNNCGVNAAAYAAMVSALGTVPYTNANSITLGTTPALVLPNGNASIFRLQLYPGDLRIETTAGGGAFQQYRFWSLFTNPGSSALIDWPNSNSAGTSQIVWGIFNPSGTYQLNFTANGQLIFRAGTQSGNNGLWVASINYPIPPTCFVQP
jgi:hypothetical protein